MPRNIGLDLRKRMTADFGKGLCTVPTSTSDARRLREACKSGHLVSPGPQLYALPEQWTSLDPLARERYRIRSLAQLHPEWVFVGVSAAVLHELEVSYALLGPIHIATNRAKRSRSHDPIHRHPMPHVDTVREQGVRATTIERTTFDCLRTCGFRHALSIADSAIRKGNRSREEFLQAFERLRRQNRRWQRAHDIMSLANGLSENGGESVARAVMYEQGYWIPLLQEWVSDPVDPHNRYRVDFMWKLPWATVVGELDGRIKYTDPAMTQDRDAVQVMADERLRESRLAGNDMRVMRFSYANVVDTDYFCHLLDSYGIPKGFLVPAVARLDDPLNAY